MGMGFWRTTPACSPAHTSCASRGWGGPSWVGVGVGVDDAGGSRLQGPRACAQGQKAPLLLLKRPHVHAACTPACTHGALNTPAPPPPGRTRPRPQPQPHAPTPTHVSTATGRPPMPCRATGPRRRGRQGRAAGRRRPQHRRRLPGQQHRARQHQGHRAGPAGRSASWGRGGGRSPASPYANVAGGPP